MAYDIYAERAREKCHSTVERWFGSPATKAAYKQRDEREKTAEDALEGLRKELQKRYTDDKNSDSIIQQINALRRRAKSINQVDEDLGRPVGAGGNDQEEKKPVLSTKERKELHRNLDSARLTMLYGGDGFTRRCEEKCAELDEPCEIFKAMYDLNTRTDFS